jgi:hypothetical protein
MEGVHNCQWSYQANCGECVKELGIELGAWEMLTLDFENGQREDEVYIEAALLEEIAQDFEHIRGRKVQGKEATSEN